MDTYGLQPANPHTDHADASGLWPEQHLRYPVHLSEPEPPRSTDSSYRSYHTANASPLSYLTTNSTSTLSSNMSFPFSVTSINSRKSRKNVLYPRRVHPPPLLPVPVAPEHPASSDVRFLSFLLLLILGLTTDAPALYIAPSLASPVPLYDLVAVLGDPSCACWRSAASVIGAPRGFFATRACSDRRRNSLLCRIVHRTDP
jgi:hypothetical protein